MNTNSTTAYAGTGEFWSKYRSQVSNLYDSEKMYFVPAVSESKTVLDIGCATGEFVGIISEIKKDDPFEYSGIDVSEELIELARVRHSSGRFSLYDGEKFPSFPETFDTVFSYGVLHHLSNWQSILDQMISCSKRWVLFDLRVTRQRRLGKNSAKGEQTISAQKTPLVVPYYVHCLGDIVAVLAQMGAERGFRIRTFGYQIKVSKDVRTLYSDVVALSVSVQLGAPSSSFSCKIIQE